MKEKVWGKEHTWGDKQVVELEKEIASDFSAGTAEEENLDKSYNDDVDAEQIVEVESYSYSSSDSYAYCK